MDLGNELLIVLTIIGAILALAFLRKKGGIKGVLPKSGWLIGPIAGGENHSIGMPERPTKLGAGWYFDFPVGAKKKVDYVQNFDPPRLQGAKSITADYEVTGDGFAPYHYPSKTPLVTLCFQRSGDNWSGTGKYASYRWYSKTKFKLEAGRFQLRALINPANWHNVDGKSGDSNPEGFWDAIEHLESVAVIFGHDSGNGHGVFTLKSGRFTLHNMPVER